MHYYCRDGNYFKMDHGHCVQNLRKDPMKIKECKFWEQAMTDTSKQAAVKAAIIKISRDLRQLRKLLIENDEPQS